MSYPEPGKTAGSRRRCWVCTQEDIHVNAINCGQYESWEGNVREVWAVSRHRGWGPGKQVPFLDTHTDTDTVMHLPKSEPAFPMEGHKVLREVERGYKCRKCELATVTHSHSHIFSTATQKSGFFFFPVKIKNKTKQTKPTALKVKPWTSSLTGHIAHLSAAPTLDACFSFGGFRL